MAPAKGCSGNNVVGHVGVLATYLAFPALAQGKKGFPLLAQPARDQEYSN